MYRLRGRLGRWGVGELYEAVHEETNRTVMLKLVRGRRAADANARKHMVREYQVATEVQHPSLVTIHSLEETQDLGIFHVMDLLEGETLGDAFKRGLTFVPDKAYAICSQAASALSALHRAGLAHNEICPDALFLPRVAMGRQPSVLIINAGSPHAEEIQSRPWIPLEALPYAAPERRIGVRWDFRVDIYSLCAVLMRMLVGNNPPPQGWRRPPALPPSIAALGRDLYQVASMGLKEDPNERQRTMDELYEELQSCAESTKIAAPDLQAILSAPDPVKDERASRHSQGLVGGGKPAAGKKTVLGLSGADIGPDGRIHSPISAERVDVKKTRLGLPSLAAAGPVASPAQGQTIEPSRTHEPREAPSATRLQSAPPPAPLSARPAPAGPRPVAPPALPRNPPPSPVVSPSPLSPEAASEAPAAQPKVRARRSTMEILRAEPSPQVTEGQRPLEPEAFSGAGDPLSIDVQPEQKLPTVYGRPRRIWIWLVAVGVFLVGGGVLALVILEPWKEAEKRGTSPSSPRPGPKVIPPDAGSRRPLVVDAQAPRPDAEAPGKDGSVQPGIGKDAAPPLEPDAGEDVNEGEDRHTSRKERYKMLLASGKKALRKRRYRQARTLLTKALRLRPSSNRARRYMAEAHYKSGEYWAAVFWYKKALSQSPRSASLHVDLAKAYVRAGKRSLACKHFKQALQLKPHSRSMRRNVENYRCR